MQHFTLVASTIFTALALIWSGEHLINGVIKLSFAGLAIWGWYLIFHWR